MGPYRLGPWPGLTPRGGGVLVGCAALMGLAQTLLGPPRTAVPDLPLLGLTALLPMALATRIVRAPGAASAVCGAYLMPRALLSLAQPGLELPPLLLVPAVAFDLALWLRRGDLARLVPRRNARWRKRARPTHRTLNVLRAAIAGAVFGLILALVEPPFALFLGADAATWSGQNLLLAQGMTVLASAVIGPLSARGTAS